MRGAEDKEQAASREIVTILEKKPWGKKLLSKNTPMLKMASWLPKV